MTKTFIIKRPNLRYFYNIQSLDEKEKVYYGNVNSLPRGRPDVTIHEGDSKEAPMVSMIHFPSWTRNFKYGLGSSADVECAKWEDLLSKKANGAEHEWYMDLPAAPSDAPMGASSPRTERRTFTWKRTRHVVVDGTTKTGIGQRKWKLVTETENEVLAVFTNSPTMGVCGTLQVNVDYGDEFELAVLTTLMTLYERSMRM